MSVTVFTGATCPSCVQLKRYLNYKGIAFTEKSTDEAENASEAHRISGAMSVPITLIENDKKEAIVIVGYNLNSLMRALA